MTLIQESFFELIRVAIGISDNLTQAHSDKEWKLLFDMAKKQSLVGICFAGLQRLGANADEGFARIGMSEMMYMTWMGMAAKIQQRNEVVNKQCVNLQNRLSLNGLQCCILKGQGVASLYKCSGLNGSSLSMLRQSGDIDVWVQNKSIPELAEYCKGLSIAYKATVAHVECQMLERSDVELHAEPAFMRNFWTNRKLVRWFHNSKGSIVKNEHGLNIPTNEFNLVYMMVHMYHHVLFEGLGLRQLMDYYFVLLTSYDNDNIISILDSLGMMRFAKGIMWIMREVFGLEDKYMICEASEKYGRLILEDVLSGGNFGHHDEKNKGLHGGTAVSRSLNGLKRNMKFFAIGPWEILCSPLWSTWHWGWRRRKGLL